MKLQFNSELNREIANFNFDGREFSVPRQLHNRYEICDILAAGGMGVIFIAKDTKLFDKKVLIKRCLYNPSLFQYKNDTNREKTISKSRNTMEMERASMLHGWARQIPNIPVPIDFFKDINPEIYGPHKDINGNPFICEKDLYEKEPYLVINYFTGRPVKGDHPEVAKNVVEFVKFYINTIANILTRFHKPYKSCGKTFEFFYCDLKPDNVILTNDKRIILIDMGSFAIRVNGKLANEITTTPGYCAPELKNNQAMFLSPSVDVYTLAVSAFEIITKQPPKLDQHGNLILGWNKFKNIVNSTNQKYLIDVFKKALDIGPDNRFQTMQDFTNALYQKNNKTYQVNAVDYLQKTLKNPVQITSDWQTQKGSLFYEEKTKGNIINYPVWKKETFFDIQANAAKINSKISLDTMKQNLLMNLFDDSKDNLIQNLTFCPELLEITSQNIYLNYMPGLVNSNKQATEWEVEKNLIKILYLFISLINTNYRMTGVSPDTIKFDKLSNPFIYEYWLMLNNKMYNFIKNPYAQHVVGKNVILPPEIKKDRIWINKKSFSYLAGISALLMIKQRETLALYNRNELYVKIKYEKFVRELGISDNLKDTILNLINPLANMRLSPFEAISQLKNRPRNTISRELKNRGIQIQYTMRLMKYQFQHKEIGKITNKILNWQLFEKNIILHYTPNSNFEEMLKKTKTKYHVKNNNAKDIIVELLNEKIKNKQTELAVLIVDNTINQMKNKLSNILKSFKKVILFSDQNPFDLSNVQYYSIHNFMIQKAKKRR